MASESEIKSSYKKRALECHPDKVAERGGSEVEQAAAAESFKLLGEALEVLGDQMRRKLYDEGHDKDGIEDRVQAAERAARDPKGHHRHH